ncbi:MAG: hypothetical protein MZV70_68920 [Desulfobacterales bacterium]|nr:hypothetical protein [Desulfobacterales bacterium]
MQSMSETRNNLAECRVETSPPDKRVDNVVCPILFCVLAAIFILEIVLCMTPPTARDALIHHLAIPKLWIRHGGCFETPWAAFSYFPMNRRPALPPPAADRQRPCCPPFIHLLFGWGTGYLVYRYLQRSRKGAHGDCSACSFSSAPRW